MKKFVIVFVMTNLLLAVPALAAVSNGFNTDHVYGLAGAVTNIYDQATGASVGSLPVGGVDTLTFSCSTTPGVNTPAGARLFTAVPFDRSGNGKNDDIRIAEWDSAGNELRRTYLQTAFGTLAPNPSYALTLGTLRYNQVNNTLIVSANPGNKTPGTIAQKAWEFQLPDWAYSGSVAGGTVTPVHTYTMLNGYKNRCNIDIAPDGMMYTTGYNYGSGTSGRSKISRTPTDPLHPDFGNNIVVLDGPAYYTASGNGQFYQQSAIVYVDCERAAGVFVPELITSFESTTNQTQVHGWDWNGPWVGGQGPFGEVGRIGTPGGAVGWRARGIRGQRDPLTNEVFMVGNVSGTAGMGGILQLGAGPPRYSGSFVIDDLVGIGDAASPAPEPATLMLLAIGLVPMLRRRRR
jgi:hypothetical protein